MKTFVCSWIILGLMTVGAFANPGIKKNSKAKPQLSLEQQLSSQLTYPAALQNATGNGIVVVQFRLSNDNHLIEPVVYTNNKPLNDELTRQLLKTRLSVPEGSAGEQVHTARLRFTNIQ